MNRIIMRSPNKSCSLDPIPTWFLKENVHHILPVLTKIINSSLLSGKFPSVLRSTIVRPLLKKPKLDQNCLANYRPISSLSFLGKVTEKVACQRLTQHMCKNDLWDAHQSAYRPNHSTESALIKVKNDILFAMDKGKVVLVLSLDLTAAFDTIDREILTSRLSSRVCVRDTALKWFKSYLDDWTSSVEINGKQSPAVVNSIGLPQGSVFGPIGYTIYTLPIADIAKSHNVSYHTYADDTQLYLALDPKEPDGLERALRTLSACVTDIKTWMCRNKLKLNEEKTEFLVAGSQNHAPSQFEQCQSYPW